MLTWMNKQYGTLTRPAPDSPQTPRLSPRLTLRKIGFHFEIDNDSTVGSVIERMRKKLAGDRKLRIRLDKLEASILRGQERT